MVGEFARSAIHYEARFIPHAPRVKCGALQSFECGHSAKKHEDFRASLLHFVIEGLMPTPRPVFRIAEYFAVDDDAPQDPILKGADAASAAGDVHLAWLRHELVLMHHAIDRTKQEIAALHAQGFGKHGQARAGRGLAAVIDTAGNATHSVLRSAEIIEDLARSLAASLRLPQERDMARDILDHVTQIFESCNFQDVCGQHLTHAIATLKAVDDCVSRISEIWEGIESDAAASHVASALSLTSGLLNGPKLEGDAGHVSQSDIDRLFSGESD